MKQRIDPCTIAITLITQYPRWYQGKLRSIKHTDKIRGDLALTFIQKAIAETYQVIVADGKSSKSFRKKVGSIASIHLIKRTNHKRAPSRRLTITAAKKLPEVKVIIATEPEKVSLLDFIPELVTPILHGTAHIVIPKRNREEFKHSYPPFQFDSENEGNNLYNEYLRINQLLHAGSEDLDLFFGPRIYKNDPKVIALVLKRAFFRLGNHTFPKEYFDPEELSNASFFPIVLALKNHLHVVSITIPFVYLPLQKENEEIGEKEQFEEKRRFQKLGLLVELMHFMSSLKK